MGPTIMNLLFIECTDTFAWKERGVFCERNYLRGFYCVLYLVKTVLKFVSIHVALMMLKFRTQR